MARKVEHDWEKERNKPGPQAKYPWDQWLDGDTWELIRNFDFRCKVETFKQLASRTARERRLKVNWWNGINEDVIFMQAYRPEKWMSQKELEELWEREEEDLGLMVDPRSIKDGGEKDA